MMLRVGLVLGFVPVSASGSSCGSAFVGSDSASVDDYTTVLMGGSLRDATHADDCEGARSMWRVPALALTIPGALLTLGAGVVLVGEVLPKEKAVASEPDLGSVLGPGL